MTEGTRDGPGGLAPGRRKRINLALQGGGAHGAFTWGVIDRVMEDGRLEIDGISGTSAGAMNATVTAYGLAKGYEQGARDALAGFWREVAGAARFGPLQPTVFDRLFSPGNMDFSPVFHAFDQLSRMASPYQFNPMNINPLREVLERAVDFDALHCARCVKLFLCATNVLSGKIQVFETTEIGIDHVLASACLPFLFQAIEIDGAYYWDGGYMGNPPIFPLIYKTDTADMLIVQINPIKAKTLPTTAQEIHDRVNELSFNSSLMREMRAIHFVTKLIEQGCLAPPRYREIFIHTIDAEAEMDTLNVSSKLNADPAFLDYLFALGRDRAGTWLDRHFDDVGERSTTDIEERFM